MKPIWSRDYYERYWEEFLKPVPGDDYINLEGQLEYDLKVYREAGINEDKIELIRTRIAQKIAEGADKIVRKELEVIKNIESGKSSLGYTTQNQEISAKKDYRMRFEFNCLQLKKFKEKYNV